VAAGPEIQQPEVQSYDRYSDANGAYHCRPSFYSPPGYTQCVYPNGVQYTSFPEIQRFSRPDNVSYAYPYGVAGVPCPSQEVETRQVDKVLPEQYPSKGLSRQPEMDGDMVARPNPESRQDTTVKISAETPETGSTELETVGTVYHTARTKCDDSAFKAQRKQVKRRKKSREFKHGAPRNPNGGANASSHRQPVVTRHTAPSAYSGVSPTPLSSRGPHPASHGNR